METRDDRRPVVVVGGGLSGLAAAVDLGAAGIPVLLLEQKPFAGGRACSYVDATTGDTIDNGQHLLIAGYQHTLAFLDRIGARHLTITQPRPVIPFHHPDLGMVDFRLPRLPSPLHLAWGIATTRLVNLRDRVGLIRAGRAMRRLGPDSGLTIAQWLDAHRQSAEVRRCFWEPLAVAVMNERPERASAWLFVRSLRLAFLGRWHNAALVFPTVGLSNLFVDPAQAFIEHHGGAVRCGADVVSLDASGDKVVSVTLRGGEKISCRSVILAVPPSRAAALWPSGIPFPAGMEAMACAPASPILSIHLWFDRPFMDLDVVGLIGRRVQWLFRKKNHVSATISAAYDLTGLSNAELEAIAVEDVRSVFGANTGLLKHSVIIREKKATLSVTPENEGKRPGACTAAANLFLAGDWTQTWLPATIEGAILSGQVCASLASGG